MLPRALILLALAASVAAQPPWLYPSGTWNPTLPAPQNLSPAPYFAVIQTEIAGPVTLSFVVARTVWTPGPPPLPGELTTMFLALWVEGGEPVLVSLAWLDGWGPDGAVIDGIRPFIGPLPIAGITLWAQAVVTYGGTAWLTNAYEMDVY